MDLNLSLNPLTGEIPPELANLSNLQALSLGRNQMSGQIPAWLGNLSGLRFLFLSGGQYTGSIPAELGSLVNLSGLFLQSNQLTGAIPPGLGNLASLGTLHLGGNQLSGPIPVELGNLANLHTLTLSTNQLTGPIPPELGNLANLQRLTLSFNRLSGALPPDLGEITDLLGLVLEGNQFTGPVPPELAGLVNLAPSDGLGLRWNSLFTDDDSLRDFLNSKQFGNDWESTQTVAPENLAATPYQQSVLLRWDPIAFGGGGGRYLVSFSADQGGPYELFGTTANKDAASLEVTGLAPSTEYFFVVQSQSDAHASNQSTLTSGFSLELSATTAGVYWLYGPGNPTGSEDGFNGIALTNFSDSTDQATLEAVLSRSEIASVQAESPRGEGNQVSGVELRAGAQRALLRSDLFEVDPDEPAWMGLTSNNGKIGTFFQFGTGALSQLDGGVAITETSTSVILTRIFDGAGAFGGETATTRISILNPNPDPVSIELQYRPPGNQGAGTQGSSGVTHTIAAGSFLDERAVDLLGLSPSGEGEPLSGGAITGKVTEGEGVVAFELIQLTNQSTVLGLNAATGNPTNRAYSAQLASQPGLFTSVNVVNASDGQRNVTLRAVKEDGSDQGNPVVMVLGPGEQFTEDAGVLFGTGVAGRHPAQGESFVGSLVVEADGDGVVGDVIFGDSADFAFGASLPLQTEAFTEALFNQVANVSGFFTGLAFFYPEQSQGASPQGPQPAAEITIQVFLPGGEMAGESMVILAPGERISRLVEQLVGELALAGGYVRIFSTERIIGQMLFGVIGPGGIQLFSAVPPTVVR